jgi:D-alanyl-lipoteichoic acid acyltransferase DltB (MBOAT superfamily)
LINEKALTPKHLYFFLFNIFTLATLVALNWISPWMLLVYALIIIGQHQLILWCVRGHSKIAGCLCYGIPFLFLVIYKGLAFFEGNAFLTQLTDFGVFLGFSYLIFRLMLTTYQILESKEKATSAISYLCYFTYAPLLFVGPITSYQTFSKSISDLSINPGNILGGLNRILVGLLKVTFLSLVFKQFDFAVFLTGDIEVSLMNLVFVCMAFHLFIFFNFSGFCDIVLGLSEALALKVDENFSYPFLSTNLREYWQSWHITLGTLLRELVFFPVSKTLFKLLGKKYQWISVVLSLLVVFILVGLWHKFSLNFLVFGLLQALGVIVCYSWRNGMRRLLPKHLFELYLSHPAFKSAGAMLTFLYSSSTLFFFANSWERGLALIFLLNGATCSK